MTSSKYLRSGVRKGFAFPIMLAAVGLLLASLVLGLGTNLAQALGDEEGGICGYSDLMRDAILANNGDDSFDCDGATYTGVDPSWGGSEGILGTPPEQDEAKDLDLSDKGISVFAPGKGELDGFRVGSRVDLRGNGLSVADLDVSDATGSFADADGDAVAYSKFGDSIGKGDGTSTNAAMPPSGMGLTFLLDGGSGANGFTETSFEGTEGEITWLTFEYGDKPKDFVNHDKAGANNDGGVWMLVSFTIETVDGAADETVYALINSDDADGTIYAVPYRIRDNAVNKQGRVDDLSVEVALVSVGTHAEATGAVAVPDDANFDGDGDVVFTAEEFRKDSLPRGGDEVDLAAVDEDAPAVSVGDRQDAVADPITDQVDLSTKNVGVDQLAGEDTGGDPGGLLTTLAVGKANPNDGDKIDAITPGDLSGLTGLTAAMPNAALNLSGNALTELPSGLFADVGATSKGDLTTLIDLTGNEGPTGDGFMLDNLGAVADELIAGQVLMVDDPEKDTRNGFIQSSYEATEGGVWVFDVNIQTADAAARAAVQFLKLDGDSGKVTSDKKDKDAGSEFIDLGLLEKGNYRIAIGLPTNEVEDTDNTLTVVFGYANVGADITGITTALDFVPLTIRDASYEAPAPEPVAGESSFGTIVVLQNEYVEDPTG